MNKLWDVLKTEADYDIALERTIEIFHAEQDSPESVELEILSKLVIDYENIHYPIPEPDHLEE